MDNYNYKYTDAELELLKQHFAENEPLLKLLRKMFLPTFSNSAADVGGLRDDISTHPDLNIKSYPTLNQAIVGIQAHSKAIQHVESTLLGIKMLAGTRKESVEELKKRLDKNSAK